jgi:hypothetical protein
MNRYSESRFFAEKTSARKGADLAGTVLIAPKRPTRAQRNGITVMVVGVPDGGGVPCATWASPDYLERSCIEVTEEQARRLVPAFFRALEAYDRSPEYRLGHALTVAEGVRRGTYPAVLAVLRPSGPIETAEGFTH